VIQFLEMMVEHNWWFLLAAVVSLGLCWVGLSPWEHEFLVGSPTMGWNRIFLAQKINGYKA
jgi:hypothetical protein